MREVPLLSMSMSASWLNQQLTCWQRDQAFRLGSNGGPRSTGIAEANRPRDQGSSTLVEFGRKGPERLAWREGGIA